MQEVSGHRAQVGTVPPEHMNWTPLFRSLPLTMLSEQKYGNSTPRCSSAATSFAAGTQGTSTYTMMYRKAANEATQKAAKMRSSSHTSIQHTLAPPEPAIATRPGPAAKGGYLEEKGAAAALVRRSPMQAELL